MSHIELLEIQSYAPLDVVGTENYIRYGLTGPLRYVSGIPQGHTTPQLLEVFLEIAGAEHTINLTVGSLKFQQIYHEALRRTVWKSQYALFGLETTWVWDFFRMLSFLQMRVQITDKEKAEKSTLEFQETFRKIDRGTIINLTAMPPSGDIAQQHQLEAQVQVR